MNSGAILVVEDDAILALDLADILQEAGYEVFNPVSTNDLAHRAIEARRPSCALLDYNLGPETSVPTAVALALRGIPFAYVTGRPDAVATNPLAPSARIIAKPYRASEILQAIADLAA